MRKILIGLSLTLFSTISIAQLPTLDTPDRNPLLTAAESAYLNAAIGGDSFDFTGKHVGYVEVIPGGFYGAGTYITPEEKRFALPFEKRGDRHELFILDTAEKRRSLGFDAVIVTSRSNHQGKRRRVSREEILEDVINRWIDIPEAAGQDSGEVLNAADAAVFRAVYARGYFLTETENFTGKRVAILDFERDPAYALKQITVPEHIRRLRQLQSVRFGIPDYSTPHKLNAEQKVASGGYDYIFEPQSKKGYTTESLIAALKRLDTQQMRGDSQTPQTAAQARKSGKK